MTDRENYDGTRDELTADHIGEAAPPPIAAPQPSQPGISREGQNLFSEFTSLLLSFLWWAAVTLVGVFIVTNPDDRIWRTLAGWGLIALAVLRFAYVAWKRAKGMLSSLK